MTAGACRAPRALLARRRCLIRIGAGVGTSMVLCGPRALAQTAVSVPAEVRDAIPAARLIGQGRLRFLGLSIYDSRLWVAEGFEADRFAEHAFALELIYSRKLVGVQIAERSLQEMQRVPGISTTQAEQWLAAMTEAFPDVQANDRITGINLPRNAARFMLNGKLRRDIADVEFARRFFGIWLADTSSQPALRQALLGRG